MNKIMLSLNENYILNESNVIINPDHLRIPSNMIPIYVILASGNSFWSKVISGATGGEFTHAALSTKGLDEFYSFNDGNSDNGFSVESIKYLRDDGCRKIRIYTCFVDADVYKDMNNTIYDIKNNSVGYNNKDFFLFPFKRNYSFVDKKDLTKFYCSEFVLWVLNHSMKTNFEKVKNKNMSPSGIINVLNKIQMYCIYDGDPLSIDNNFILNFEKRNKIYNKKYSLLK